MGGGASTCRIAMRDLSPRGRWRTIKACATLSMYIYHSLSANHTQWWSMVKQERNDEGKIMYKYLMFKGRSS